MTANNTWVHVTDDHLMDAIKVHVTPPTMMYAISKQELLYAFNKDHVIYKVAKEMGHMLAKEVEKRLHDILVPPVPKGTWVPVPGSDPVAEIKETLEVHEQAIVAKVKAFHEHEMNAWSSGPFKGVNPPFAVLDELTGFDYQMDLGTAVTEMLYDAIPGFSDMKQPCPDESCKSGFRHDWTPLRNTIIHLNDHHKWSRERIADWLETLDHDLTFKTPGEVNADAGHADT